jgi:hypothetical protein
VRLGRDQHDRQTEAAPACGAIRSAYEEALEEQGSVIRGDPVTVIRNLPAHILLSAPNGQSDLAARLRELVRIGHEVHDGALDSSMVSEDPHRLVTDRDRQTLGLRIEHGAQRQAHVVAEIAGVEAAQLKPNLASAESCQLERRVRQALQPLRIPLDGL